MNTEYVNPCNFGDVREQRNTDKTNPGKKRKMANGIDRQGITGNKNKTGCRAADFNEKYNEVAKANTEAENRKSGSGDSVSRSGHWKRKANAYVNKESACRLRKKTAYVSQNGGQKVPEDIVKQAIAQELLDQQTIQSKGREEAVKIIKSTLIVISETFNLDIGGDIEQIELDNPSNETVEQFSEIISALKAMSSLFENAANENVAFDIKGETVEPDKAVSMQKKIQTVLFRFQLSMGVLGIGREAAFGEKNISDHPAGILQAVNPENIEMSGPQLKNLFEGIVEDSENRIKSVLDKIRALAGGEDMKSDGKKAVFLKADITAEKHTEHTGAVMETEGKSVKPTNTAGKIFFGSETEQDGKQGDNKAKNSEYSAFLSSLKRIAGQPVSNPREQGVFAEKAKTDTPPEDFFKGFSQAGKVSGKELIEYLNTASQNRESLGNTEGIQLNSPQMTEMNSKVLSPLAKSFEEFVMNQVNERVQTVLKGGNGIHQLRIQLHPRSLGEMTLRVQMDGDIVTAKMNVENQQVKQIIEANMQMLKDALARHNFQSGDIDVSVNDGSDGENGGYGAEKRAVSGNDMANGAAEVSSDKKYYSIEIGKETGKRYGSNSIEYFA